MNAQEIFDTVVGHLFEQGRPARPINRHLCQYRHVADDGTVLKCAAGFLIPDDVYDKGMEGMTANHVVRMYLPSLMAYAPLIRELQGAHDDPVHPVGGFRTETLINDLRSVAHRFSLSDECLSHHEHSVTPQ